MEQHSVTGMCSNLHIALDIYHGQLGKKLTQDKGDGCVALAWSILG